MMKSGGNRKRQIAGKGGMSSQEYNNLRCDTIYCEQLRFTNDAGSIIVNNGLPGNSEPINQGYDCINIGSNAGKFNQGTRSIAIGIQAGEVSLGLESIAIGPQSSRYNSASQTINIGHQAGYCNFSTRNRTIAIGSQAGYTNQGLNSISIGEDAGYYNLGNNSEAIGYRAGSNGIIGYSTRIGSQFANIVPISPNSGEYSIAIGSDAGTSNQGSGSIGIGIFAGSVNQSDDCIAIAGQYGGEGRPDTQSIAIGIQAGRISQGPQSLAIGYSAGYNNQKVGSVATGVYAGYCNQGSYATAIGYHSGETNQGVAAVSIGNNSGKLNQPQSSIIIGNNVTATLPGSFYLGLILDVSVDNSGSVGVLQYNTGTKEVVYNTGKNFIIPHPEYNDKYLVHSCLEGPEAAVYYRGCCNINDSCKAVVELPSYVKHLAHNFQVIPSISWTEKDSNNVIASSVKNGEYFELVSKFPCKVNYTVFATRKDIKNIDVEVNKNDVIIKGEGPYKYIINR